MSEWQPIETAPKDGTEVLVYEPGDHIEVAFTDDGEFWWTTNIDRCMQPTHWMPLPRKP